MRRFAGRMQSDLVSNIPGPGADGEIRIGTWIEGRDGSLFRCSTIPAGMTIEEAERIVAQPGWKDQKRDQEKLMLRVHSREDALYLRSVYRITAALHGLRGHPLTCMLLKIR